MPLAIGLAVVLVIAIVAWVVRVRMARAKGTPGPDDHFSRQLVVIAAVIVVLLMGVVFIPDEIVKPQVRSQLLTLIGLVFTAIITLSSASFASNAMAGLMLRTLQNFRLGDFIRVDECFGRVTERGLFHTEIQTEDRDLTTIPNLHLVSRPVTVIRASGTVVSATVGLGYDQDHQRLERLFERAALDAGLSDPFVQIIELQDHAVVYRVAGFLKDVKKVLSSRSRLRGAILDTLHGQGIEIASPSFMIQRPQAEPQPAIPAERPVVQAAPKRDTSPEAKVFDKAESAERIEDLKAEHATLTERLGELAKGDETKDERERLERRLEGLAAQIERATQRHSDDKA